MIIFKKPHLDTFSIRMCAEGVNEEDELKKVKDIDPNAYIVSSLPENRMFRDAWCKCSKNEKVVINEDKAKELHMERIRAVRNKKLEDLDKESIRYLANADKLKEVEEEKQKLRDIPQNFEVDKFDLKDPTKGWPKDIPMHPVYRVDK